MSTSFKKICFSPNKKERFLCKMNFAVVPFVRFDGINCFWGQNCLLNVSELPISFKGWSLYALSRTLNLFSGDETMPKKAAKKAVKKAVKKSVKKAAKKVTKKAAKKVTKKAPCRKACSKED
ncbi:MAG: hypothetical protein LBP87_12935 [Planctomycetaceae bacterium]|nr:hypothetical protein [Planctomycetaceae bacterium]